jgi:hypothetical protein
MLIPATWHYYRAIWQNAQGRSWLQAAPGITNRRFSKVLAVRAMIQSCRKNPGTVLYDNSAHFSPDSSNE